MPIGRHVWAWRILGLAAVIALTEFAVLQITERIRERYPLTSFDRSRYAEQIVSLRSYAARRRLGSFLPPTDAELSLRETMLQSVLARSLPIRQEFENGRYLARLDRAHLDFEEGLANITLFGHGTMAGEGASPLEADLELQTHIDVVEFRPQLGTLRAGLAVTGVHVIRAGGKGQNGMFWNPVARYFSGLKGEDWNRERPTIDIPIRLDREITLPPIVGELTVAKRTVPLDIGVSAVTVHRDRLILSLAVRLGGSGATGVGGGRDTTSSGVHTGWVVEHPAAEKQDLERLYLKGISPGIRERLLDDVEDLAAHDPLWQGLEHSDRDVAVLVPQPLLQRICDELSRGYVREARLDFDPRVTTRFHDQVKRTFLGGKVGAGRINGLVRVEHVDGRLRIAGDPRLTLRPPNRLELATPVQVVEGSGRAHVEVKWDPGFFVAVVCRGFHFQSNLTGRVLPFSHLLTTDIQLVAVQDGIVGMPTVRRDRFTVPCEFTPASMETVKAALQQQDQLLRCGLVMNPDSVFQKVEGIVRGKIRIRLPGALFKPFALPVALSKSYDAGDFHIEARATDPEIAVRDGYLRFGFNAALTVRPAVNPITTRATYRATSSEHGADGSAADRGADAYRSTTRRLDKLLPSAASSL